MLNEGSVHLKSCKYLSFFFYIAFLYYYFGFINDAQAVDLHGAFSYCDYDSAKAASNGTCNTRAAFLDE